MNKREEVFWSLCQTIYGATGPDQLNNDQIMVLWTATDCIFDIMREPSEAMLKAVMKEYADRLNEVNEREAREDIARCLRIAFRLKWIAAIDAAGRDE